MIQPFDPNLYSSAEIQAFTWAFRHPRLIAESTVSSAVPTRSLVSTSLEPTRDAWFRFLDSESPKLESENQTNAEPSVDQVRSTRTSLTLGMTSHKKCNRGRPQSQDWSEVLIAYELAKQTAQNSGIKFSTKLWLAEKHISSASFKRARGRLKTKKAHI